MIIGPTELRPVTATRGTGSVLPAALAGKVIEARLIMALGDGIFRFTAAENEFDLPLPRNLPPGTHVRISRQPGGSYEVTVLDEGAVPARPPGTAPLALKPFLPPGVQPPAQGQNATVQTVTLRPATPAPPLPPGQPVEARVVSNPSGGIVRVAAPGGEIDLPLPRPLAPGTAVRIVAQPGGALQVTLPPAPGAAAPAAPSRPVSAPSAPPPTAHPSVFTVRPEGPPPQLPPGQVVEARIVSAPQTPGDPVRFATADGEFDLPLPKVFPPGTQVRIVAQPGNTFVVTVRPEAVPASVPRTGPAGAAPAPQAASPSVPQAVSAPPPSPRPAVITIAPEARPPGFAPSQPVEARVVSPPGPGGMTRLAAPAGEFDLPLPQSLPVGTAVRVVPQPNGGLTLVTVAPEPSEPAVRTASPPQPQAAEAVRQAIGQAFTKQDGLAKVFSSIADLPFRLNAPMPVRRAAEKLLDQRLPLEFATRPQQLARAIAASGVFAEHSLTSLPPTANAPPDLKLALFILRAALGSWSPVRGDAPPRAEGHIPPPLPGAPPAAQPPADAASRAITQNMPADEFVPRVLHETDGAISRINLHQFASLPDERAAARGDMPEGRFSCEVPVNVDGRTAIFGFVVERDGRHASQEREKKKWRVRAAVDLGDTGAIEADVRLRGETVSAGILADRAEIVEKLETALPLLRDGLTAAGFEVESLWVKLGKGSAQPGPPGHFVDRKT